MFGLYKLIALLVFLHASLFCASVSAQSLSLYCEEDRPLQFFDEEGKLTGMTIEIVREIQKRVGNNDTIQVVPWSRGIDKINANPNTMLFTMARTPERESLYQWIGPIKANVYGLYAKSDSTLEINSLEDAKKIPLIGVYRGDVRDQTLTRLGFTNLDRASSNISSFKKLMIGRISAYTDSKLGVESLALASGYAANDVKFIFELFRSDLYIAVSKSTEPAVVKKWNTALESMKKDKTFQQIQQKYLHDEMQNKIVK